VYQRRRRPSSPWTWTSVVGANAVADAAGKTSASSRGQTHLREPGPDALAEVTLVDERGTREKTECFHRGKDRGAFESRAARDVLIRSPFRRRSPATAAFAFAFAFAPTPTSTSDVHADVHADAHADVHADVHV